MQLLCLVVALATLSSRLIPEALCDPWAKLPTNKYYLAACVSDLKEIMDMDGDPDANPMRVSDGIVWHIPGNVFEPCQCIGNMRGKIRHSDLAQVLFPSKLSYVLPKKKPVPLEDHGAVIFGHNMNFKWFWKDTGDPEEGEPPSPPKSPRSTSTTAQSDRAWTRQPRKAVDVSRVQALTNHQVRGSPVSHSMILLKQNLPGPTRTNCRLL